MPEALAAAAAAAATATVDLPDPREARGYEVLMAQLGLADLIVGEVAGVLELEALRESAFHSMIRHPGLRARVRWPRGRSARPQFEYLPADPLRLDVSQVGPEDDPGKADGRPLWQRVAEQESVHHFDLEAGYPFRVVWVPQPQGDGGHLIINASHTIVDGVSLMRLLHEILWNHAAVQEGADSPARFQPEPLMPTPPVLAAFRTGLWDAILARLAREYAVHRQRSFYKWCPFPIQRHLKPGEDVGTLCQFRAGDPENWRRIRRKCRDRGVTVGGAYAAAIQFAALHFIYKQTGRFEVERGLVNFPMSMDYSLRRLVPGAYLSQAELGLFTGISEIGLKVPARISFWDLARTLMGSTVKQLEDGTPLLFHRAAERLGDLERFKESRGIDHKATGGAGEAVQISNVGIYPYSVDHRSLRLERVYGCNGAIQGGPLLAYWLRSINDHFCYNAVATSPAIERRDAETLFGAVVALMERCADPDVEALDLARFVKG
jgi:hypothetical protein